MTKQIAELKVKRALNHNTPAASDHSYQPGAKFLIWRKNLVENRIGAWVGTYIVFSFDKNSRPFSYIRILTLGLGATTSLMSNHSWNQLSFHQLYEFSPKNVRTFLISFANLEYAHYRSSWQEWLSCRVTKNANRIKNEVRDLLRRGTFEVTLKEELPDGANECSARFVPAIKSNADQDVKYKARYVIAGHRDLKKSSLFTAHKRCKYPRIGFFSHWG